MMYDPFEDYRMRGAPSMHRQRAYQKPMIVRMQPSYPREQRYVPEMELHRTARVVVGGAVVVGTLGLLGGIFNR